ncbi:hypothetical protein [Phaeacidiphilus oryzae]|uniref:hypothetical protein n=1 Tax=Phaeacidiphilus oryzae TaxID=348818 RepID=UPI00126A7A3D|nr:hypothetical protein [Phaeacidiphilus oryzae]
MEAIDMPHIGASHPRVISVIVSGLLLATAAATGCGSSSQNSASGSGASLTSEMTAWTSNTITLLETGNYADQGTFSCATGQPAIQALQALPQPPYDQQDWSMFTAHLEASYKDSCVGAGSSNYAADHQAAKTGWTQFVNSVNAKWPTLGQQLETAPLDF